MAELSTGVLVNVRAGAGACCALRALRADIVEECECAIGVTVGNGRRVEGEEEEEEVVVEARCVMLGRACDAKERNARPAADWRKYKLLLTRERSKEMRIAVHGERISGNGVFGQGGGVRREEEEEEAVFLER